MLRVWESVWGECGKLCGCVEGGKEKCGVGMKKCVGVCGEVRGEMWESGGRWREVCGNRGVREGVLGGVE